MTQLFSNNLDTTLAAALSDVATSATLSDGAGLNAPTGGDHEMVTLIVAGTVEIVKVTARSANVITIVRAQEGTTARAWATGTRVFAGVTAGTLAATADAIVNKTPATVEAIAAGEGATAHGLGTAYGFESEALSEDGGEGFGSVDNGRATAFGNRARARGYQSVAIGRLAHAEFIQSIAIGESSYSTRWGTIAIGEFATAGDWWHDDPSRGDWSIAIGAECGAEDEDGISIGRYSWTENGRGAIAIGWGATAENEDTISIGTFAEVTGDAGVCIGVSRVSTDHTLHIGALPAVPRAAVGLSAGESNAAWRWSSATAVIMSGALDLKTLQTYTIPIPTGVTFFPDEVGVIITAAAGVTGQPTLRFGTTGTEAKYLAATATTGMEAVHDRERFATLLSSAGAKTLRAEVTVAATGTTLTGRIYWRGTAMVD